MSECVHQVLDMASAVAFSGTTSVSGGGGGGSHRLPPLRRSATTHSSSSPVHSSPRSPRSPSSPSHRHFHQNIPLLQQHNHRSCEESGTSAGDEGAAAGNLGAGNGRPTFGVMDKGMRTIPGKVFWKGKYIDQNMFYQVRNCMMTRIN